MIAKEKAIELVNKFLSYSWISNEEGNEVYSNTESAKQCAIISAKNEYYSNRELLFNLKSCGVQISEKVYLKRIQDLIDEEEELIKEIEKL